MARVPRCTGAAEVWSLISLSLDGDSGKLTGIFLASPGTRAWRSSKLCLSCYPAQATVPETGLGAGRCWEGQGKAVPWAGTVPTSDTAMPCPSSSPPPRTGGGRGGRHNTAVENCWLLGELLSTPTLAVTVTVPPWTTSGWGGGKQEGGMKEDHKNTSGHQQSKLYLFPHHHPPTHCRPALNLMPWEVFPWQRRAWVWSSYGEAPEPSPTRPRVL